MDIDEAETTQNMSITSPPPKRFHPLPSPMRHRVRNPFEAAMVDRLHLPLIASPSLFQRPATPQLSSTQFEWTIEEVSSIKPANVEPHETQFQDSPDPEYEAKAQMAISSYFREHQIVPSPVNCSARQQRIILAEINGNTPIGKPGRRIRDFGTQTALSLPVDLPPALEEALRPYFQPHLDGCYTEDGNAIHNWHDSSEYNSKNSSQSGGGAHNVSMRRKLFDIHNIILWDESRRTQTPKTPQLSSASSSVGTACQLQQPMPVPSIMGKLSDSLSSSDLLSPISGSDCLSGSPRSPNNSHATIANDGSQNINSASNLKKHSLEFEKSINAKPPRRIFLFNPSDAELSPIYPSPRNKTKTVRQMDDASDEQTLPKDFVTPAKIRQANFARRRLTTAATANNDDEDDFDIEKNTTKFTPDRSSSPLHSFHSSASACENNTEHATTIATESFHVRISRLAVNSSKLSHNNGGVGKLGIAPTDDTETGDIVDDDDVMQVSQLSMQNSNLSSGSINSHCDTPTGKRRSASRKNLSQSFTANWPQEDDDEDDENVGISNVEKIEPQLNGNFATVNGEAVKHTNTNVQKVQLSDITNFISEKAITTHAQRVTNDTQKQIQQQSVNFYRTDSGFNEMTSSSTSNGLSLLSQQDELSREAFNFKSNEARSIAGSSDVVGVIDSKQYEKATFCSTPSKPLNECCLTTIGVLSNEL